MNNSKYIIDPNGERRAGCFHECLAYIVGIALALVLCLCFGSCASTKNMEKTEYNDSARTS